MVNIWHTKYTQPVWVNRCALPSPQTRYLYPESMHCLNPCGHTLPTARDSAAVPAGGSSAPIHGVEFTDFSVCCGVHVHDGRFASEATMHAVIVERVFVVRVRHLRNAILISVEVSIFPRTFPSFLCRASPETESMPLSLMSSFTTPPPHYPRRMHLMFRCIWQHVESMHLLYSNHFSQFYAGCWQNDT